MSSNSKVDLPGFRFHPTEEELLNFYLKNIVFGNTPSYCVIGMLNIYRHDPWELPGLASITGEREWYFFVPRDRKQGGSGRPNRTTQTGFWKATGSDRKVMKLSSSSDHNHKQRLIGLRKTLVFYMGRAPRGTKTDWVMNEYRLPDNSPLPKDVVLCKIYRKATSMKVLEQRAAIEEATNTNHQLYSSSSSSPSPASPIDTTVSFSSLNEEDTPMKKEAEEEESNPTNGSLNNPKTMTTTSLKLPSENEQLPQLELPRFTSDWTQDSFWTEFNSPWLQNLIASPNLLI